MKNPTAKDLQLIREEAFVVLKPENELELLFLDRIDFLMGLDWGVPRYGHPEGKIMYHIWEVLENIDCIPNLQPDQRMRLRVIAFVHDTFKYNEPRNRPRDWSKHHSVLAREFLAQFTEDTASLLITELHDEAYYAWQAFKLYRKPHKSAIRKQTLLERVGEYLQLYYLFFICDTKTGDKIQAPVHWFETTTEEIEVVRF
ncbi:MAG: HD domain-containing protein [Saprospiraceae bacterium]|nr:HD domain-containing protein [Saprospiraceae bacterium]